MPNLVGLRDRRRRTGVKTGRFARLTGYSRSGYISVENGTRPASPEGLERIADALTKLGVPTDATELLPTQTVPDDPPKQPARDPSGPARRKDAEEKKTGPRKATDSASAA